MDWADAFAAGRRYVGALVISFQNTEIFALAIFDGIELHRGDDFRCVEAAPIFVNPESKHP